MHLIRRWSPLLVLVIAWLAQPLTLQATEGVTGAFGYRFGEPLASYKSKEVFINSSGYRMFLCEVEPSLRNSQLRKYFVGLTPQSQRIKEISAYTNYDDLDSATRALGELRSTLESKYGRFERSKTQAYEYSKWQGQVRIRFGLYELLPTFPGSYALKVFYEDLTWLVKSEEESRSISKGDDSGL